MYQKYSIGMMANLLGLSAETIRYYESKHIIQPMRDTETGYRYYTTWDLHMLLRVRHYLKYGFSVEEITDLFQNKNLMEIEGDLKQQERIIEQQMIQQMNLLKRIRQSQQMIADAQNSIGKFRIEQRPGIYRMNTQKNYTLPKEKKDLAFISEWADREPFVYSCALFNQTDVLKGSGDFEFGLGLNEEYAEFLHVEQNEFVQYHPPCICVHTCIPSRSSQYLSVESLKVGLDYLKQNGLEVTGDVITQVACMSKPAEEYFNWHIVWFPIEPFFR